MSIGVVVKLLSNWQPKRAPLRVHGAQAIRISRARPLAGYELVRREDDAGAHRSVLARHQSRSLQELKSLRRAQLYASIAPRAFPRASVARDAGPFVRAASVAGFLVVRLRPRWV